MPGFGYYREGDPKNGNFWLSPPSTAGRLCPGGIAGFPQEVIDSETLWPFREISKNGQNFPRDDEGVFRYSQSVLV